MTIMTMKNMNFLILSIRLLILQTVFTRNLVKTVGTLVFPATLLFSLTFHETISPPPRVTS